MRGLVTVFGGSGFIGSQTVRALAKQGWRIRVAVRRPWQAYRLRLLGDVGQIEIVQANVRVAETVERALEGAEAVVYAVGAAFESGKQSFLMLHAEGPRLAAEAAARLGASRFVFISGMTSLPDLLMSIPAMPFMPACVVPSFVISGMSFPFIPSIPAMFMPAMLAIPISAMVRMGRGSIRGISATIPTRGASVPRA